MLGTPLKGAADKLRNQLKLNDQLISLARKLSHSVSNQHRVHIVFRTRRKDPRKQKQISTNPSESSSSRPDNVFRGNQPAVHAPSARRIRSSSSRLEARDESRFPPSSPCPSFCCGLEGRRCVERNLFGTESLCRNIRVR